MRLNAVGPLKVIGGGSPTWKRYPKQLEMMNRRGCMPSHPFRRKAAWPALLALLVVGCGAEDRQQSWSEESLPSGTLRITNQAAGVWTDGEPWRLEPEFVLGDSSGPAEEQFAEIAGLEVGPDGRIYVLDRQTNELKIFSPEGQHVATVGRPGQGPGEYLNANGLKWLAHDTLVVVDQRGGRLTVLDSHGRYVRSVSRQSGFFGWVFEGGLEGDRLYEFATTPGSEGVVPLFIGSSIRPVPNGADVRDTIFLPNPNAPSYESFSVQSDRGGGMTLAVPFAANPVYHLDGRGHVWHGHGREFRFVQTNLAGDTLREIFLDALPTPVTSAEISEWEGGDGPTRFRERGGNLDLSRIPTHKPFFDDLYVDPEGFVWAGIPTDPGESEFALFDPDGRFLGRLGVEGISRVAYISPVVRSGRVHFVGTDEFDVPEVVVLALDRGD